VKSINHRGGLNGHPVNLIAYDDGGDPARHRAQVQEAVEHRKVIAFLSQAGGLSGGGAVEYINEHRVPVIGSEGKTPGFYTSPMYFPQVSHHDALSRSWVYSTAEQSLAAGRKRLGHLYCTESPACAELDRSFRKESEAAGLELVYDAQASLTQPDFTAQCLAARNARAEVIFISLDGASVKRLAASCARQGFRPLFATGASLVEQSMKDDPNLNGMIANSPVFPYFQSGTPATDDFQRALKSFGDNISLGVGPATGWTSGRLLERAGAKLAEPPTPEGILDGLWSIKDDDLGGITIPLTFVEGEPAKPISCWFDIAVRDGLWVTPDAFKRHCLP
jgi:branched-chain amino acid transport system substrate-binding protein